MKHRVVMNIVFDSDNIGFGEATDLPDLELFKYLIKEEGLFGIIDISNDEYADGIVSVTKVEEEEETLPAKRCDNCDNHISRPGYDGVYSNCYICRDKNQWKAREEA